MADMPMQKDEKSPEALVADISAKLAELSQMVPEEQKEKVEAVVSALSELEEGEEAKMEAEMPNLVSAMGGKKGTPVGPQSRY